MKKSRYSLCEVIVVMAVLVLFTALLIPAAVNADGKSKNAACLDNMRKCRNAAAAYASENNDIMLLKSHDYPYMTLLWSMVVGRQPDDARYKAAVRLPSFAEATCPALGIVPPPADGKSGKYRAFYAVPYISLGGLGPVLDTKKNISGMYDLRNRDAYYNPVGKPSIAAIALNTAKIVSADAAVVFAEAAQVKSGDANYYYSLRSDKNLLSMRHEERTNMVFADGHAASLDVNHFMSLKDAGHILTGGQDGEVYFPEDRSVENY